MCRWQGKKCKVWFQNTPACGKWKHWRDKVNYDCHDKHQIWLFWFWSAVYFYTNTMVTLFINVNWRLYYTFPLKQTKIIPYLLHFNKTRREFDSTGCLQSPWVFNWKTIKLDKDFTSFCKGIRNLKAIKQRPNWLWTFKQSKVCV